ncbi:MAG: uroporphyrinogen-III synthase [Flavobacteriales bacterium]|nr:uroporphyrinogen-III synthase [Flavobacteriales bacterium]
MKKKKKTKVLIAQPNPSNLNSPYFDLAKKHDLNIHFSPFLSIEGETVKNIRLQKLHIPSYTSIILTSRNAVNHYFRICDEMRINVPNSMKYFCISEAVSYYLQKYIAYRKRKIYSANNSFDELVELCTKHEQENFLFVSSNFVKEEFITKLDKSEIKYRRCAFFKTVSKDLSKLKLSSFDFLISYSPRDIDAILENFPNYKQGDTKIATFGKSTNKAAVKAGFSIAINAPTENYPSMIMAMDAYLNNLK